MSTVRTSKSHAVAWTLSVLTVPVLYLLTYPIVFFAANDPSHPPAWLRYYIKPYKWICNNTPLRAPVKAYDNWWIEFFERHGK